ncbi:MAG: hypothetical protein J7M38_07730 [Armatimonadetes bacterium]|nr:hypothetical protein [Armatimonadota bacterium]
MSPDELRCPACGARIFKSDQQCLSCGAKLDEGKLVGAATPVTEVIEATAGAEAAPGPEVAYDIGRAALGGWDPGALASGGGVMASLARGWEFLKQAVAMTFKDKDLILPSAFSIIANLALLAGMVGLLHLTGDLQQITGDETAGVSTVGWVIIAVFAFTAWVVTYFFTGMTVHLVDVHLRGEDARLGSAFADCVRNIGAIVMLAVVTIVVQLIIGMLRGRNRNMVRNAAANAAERAWTVATYLMLPIIILEDLSFIDATGRATRLHRSNIIQIVVGELGLLLTTRIFTGLMTFLAVAVGAAGYLLSPALLVPALVLAVLILLATMTFAAYVRTAFYTCMYLWAVAVETVGERAPAPAPLQPAVQRAW